MNHGFEKVMHNVKQTKDSLLMNAINAFYFYNIYNV